MWYTKARMRRTIGRICQPNPKTIKSNCPPSNPHISQQKKRNPRKNITQKRTDYNQIVTQTYTLTSKYKQRIIKKMCKVQLGNNDMYNQSIKHKQI